MKRKKNKHEKLLKNYYDALRFQAETNYCLKRLSPQVRRKAEEVISLCGKEHFDLIIFSGLRKLEEQAIRYRQSRSWEEIKQKIKQLRNNGFSYLADIIEEVGPREGPFITYNAPGESWHNYAEAWDAVPYVKYRLAWNYKVYVNKWKIYGDAVRKVGMHWGGNMPQYEYYFSHAQLQQDSNPLQVLTPDQVYYKLKKNKLLK